jgi:hypothetical protein
MSASLPTCECPAARLLLPGDDVTWWFPSPDPLHAPHICGPPPNKTLKENAKNIVITFLKKIMHENYVKKFETKIFGKNV